jgi:lactose/L-arabinose transport system substrate-binding protein
MHPNTPAKGRRRKGMRKKRILALATSVVVFACVLSPVFSGGKQEGKQQTQKDTGDRFTYIVWGGVQAFEGIVQGYFDKFPSDVTGVKPEVTTGPSGYSQGDEGILAKLMSSFQAGVDIPDIFNMGASQVARLAKLGVVDDLTSWMAPYKKDFIPGAWDMITVDGKVYAVPIQLNAFFLPYRRDIFAAAGIDPASMKTWDDFLQAGKKITKDLNGDGKPDQYMVNIGATVTWNDVEWLLSPYQKSIWDSAGQVIIDKDPVVVNALKLPMKMLEEGIAYRVEDWSPEWYAALDEGVVATVLFQGGTWIGEIMQAQCKKSAGKWGIVQLPRFRNDKVTTPTTNNGGSVVCISSKSDNKELARKFISYVYLTKEGAPAFTQFPSSYKPARLSPGDAPPYPGLNDYYGGDDYIAESIKCAEAMTLMSPTSVRFREAAEILAQELQKAFSMSETFDQALKNAASAIQLRIGIPW